MSECYTFRFSEPKNGNRKSLAIFFVSKATPSSIIQSMKDDIETHLIPYRVYLIGVNTNKKSLEKLKSEITHDFISLIGDIDSKLKSILISPQGNFLFIPRVTHENLLQQKLLSSGMLEIFKKRKGLITSLSSYHFIKPSGHHCDKFIRASNLITSGVEVSFLAIGLLPCIKENIQRIYVDTSSISFLVQTALFLSKKFKNNQPIIESFESYKVTKQQYDFIEDDNSIIVVSATTSGSLVRAILESSTFNPSQVFTIFYSQIPQEQIGLYNIEKALYADIVSKDPEECPYCKEGSKVIKIVGDQFLPETPQHELLIIKKTDFTNSRERFFEEFATQNFLQWNISSSNRSDAKEHFFIDVKNIFSSPPKKLKDTLEKKLKKHISRDIKTILSLGDEGSLQLTEYIKNKYASDFSIEYLDLETTTEKDLKDKSSVVVVAGAITSGRSLLSASRKLRGIKNSASIVYFVGFSKLPTKEAQEQLRKDLCLGGHELVTLRNCYLPRIKNHIKTSWDRELEFLISCNDPLSGNSRELTTILKERMESLESLDPTLLFLPTANNHPLKLRNTFAFWSEINLVDTSNVSQADVYWTIQSILHDLRLKSDDNGLASTYHSTLISPVCFDRFNDGLIQACLLRSSTPIELNYSVDEIYSRQMTDVLFSVFENWDNAQGEASLEFLLALKTGKLKIVDKHLREIVNLNRDKMPDDIIFMMDEIEQLLPNS